MSHTLHESILPRRRTPESPSEAELCAGPWPHPGRSAPGFRESPWPRVCSAQ